MSTLLTILLLLFTGICNAQSYVTGTRSLTFIDSSRSLRQVPVTVHYPASTAGSNVSMVAGTERFPLVVFGHGFNLPVTAYKRLADSLVKYGYIVALPSTETSLFPSHDNFGKDLAFVSKMMVTQAIDPLSFFYQRMIPFSAIAGHSMGGGCSVLAAARNQPEMNALFNFAAAETNPSATAAGASVRIPSLLFSGSSDCIVAPSVQTSIYNNIPVSCKSQVTITGGTHCQVANNNGTCAFGEITSGCNFSSINVDIHLARVMPPLLAFLDYHLRQQCARGKEYVSLLSTTTGITVRNSCVSPSGCGVKARVKVFLQGYQVKADSMRSALVNPVSIGGSLMADSVSLEVRSSSDGALLVGPLSAWVSAVGIIETELPAIAGSHYLVVKHRNSIETWSAVPLSFSDSLNYDFTLSASSAYGNNLALGIGGSYVIWSGDLDQDGAVESADYTRMENDLLSILFGYHVADLTGDGVVESKDYTLLENNILKIITVKKPF